MKKKSASVWLVARWVIILAVLIAIYLPLIMIILYSFSTARSVGGDFGSFTFALYENLFKNDNLLAATKNTLIIGLVSAFISTILGTTAAIGIHYMRRKVKGVVETSSQITVVNAEIVTAMGFFLLMLFLRETVGLPVNKGMVWLIIAHTVITTPYVILTVSPRLKQLNPRLCFRNLQERWYRDLRLRLLCRLTISS